MSVVDLFRKECSFMKNEHNGDDCLVFPHIPEAVRAAVRTNFGINNNEDILLIRDTSFWSSRDQGLVITNVGFYCIVDNDNPEPFNFGWECLVDVRYQELCLHFKDNQGYEAPFHMTYFVKNSNDDYMSRIGRKLAPAFKKIAKSVEPVESPYDAAIRIYDELIEQNKYQEAIDHCLSCIENNIGDVPHLYHYFISGIYLYNLVDLDKCIEYAQKGIKACDEYSNDYFKVYLQHRLSRAYFFLENSTQTRKELLSVILNATDQKEGDTLLIKDDAVGGFKLMEEQYKNEFLTYPYNERKVLMPVKEYVDLHQEHIAVIKIQNLPEINFPIGHPVANQLYVGHPLIPSKYMPFENYQLELVEDKVREFCILVQSLGATEISIECLNSATADQNNNRKQKIDGGGNSLVAGGKGTVQQNMSRRIIDELSRSISLHQTFKPQNKPTVPENMVWYDNEPSWQRLVSQRINGGLTSHEERIETKKSQMVESQELLGIKAEIENLFAGMNLSMSKTEKSKLAQQENAVLSIKVKFAPISQLVGETNNANTPAIPNATLTPKEKEYLTELKDILADGEITARERRLLEKIRAQFGISEGRAAELEATLLAPKLTEEEQEYFDEYKTIVADGPITERERRLLDKILRLNDISPERAKEIEAMVAGKE